MSSKLQHRRHQEDLRNTWAAQVHESEPGHDHDIGGRETEYDESYTPSSSIDTDEFPYSDGWGSNKDEGDAHDTKVTEVKNQTERVLRNDRNKEDEGDVHDTKVSEVKKQTERVLCNDSNKENEGDAHNTKVRKVKKQTERVLCNCPLKGCNSKVIHLPRHLREVHEWTKEKAKKATSRFGLRKSFLPKLNEKPVQQSSGATVQEKEKQDYHRHRRCPVAGCTSVVKRLSQHIQQVHKEIKKGSSDYKQILRGAISLKTWQLSGAA